MPRRKHQPLPPPLRYLQPFVNTLSKLHPDDVNEDIDPAPLEVLLRKRISGLKLKAALAAIKADRQQIETWLRELGDRMHPAYWVLGFLSAGDVAAGLRAPAEPGPAWPEIAFDAPPGWKITAAQNGLLVKKAKLTGAILVIDMLTFNVIQRQWQCLPQTLPKEHDLRLRAVDFGQCSGTGLLVNQPFKRIDYVLQVSGGFVSIMLTGMGAAFDETEFESQLHTLHVSGANEFFDSVKPWGR